MTPKVSILITTCNRPDYFVLALQSALNQTFKDMEIVICDDSENNETEQILKNLALPHSTRLKYYKNDHRLGAAANYQKCLRLCSGIYVNFLNDDDLFHPQKIEKMLPYFIHFPQVSLVTSYRITIDRYGRRIASNMKATRRLFPKNTLINGRTLAEIVLKQCTNYIGEPTTVLFKKDKLDEPFGVYCGQEAGCNHDVASWLNLLEKGDAVYLVEPLSCFRIHGSQLQKKPEVRAEGKKDWEDHLRLWVQRHGRLM